MCIVLYYRPTHKINKINDHSHINIANNVLPIANHLMHMLKMFTLDNIVLQ